MQGAPGFRKGRPAPTGDAAMLSKDREVAGAEDAGGGRWGGVQNELVFSRPEVSAAPRTSVSLTGPGGGERSEAEAGANRTVRRFDRGYPPLAPPHQPPARSRQRHHTGVAGSVTAEDQREDNRKRLALCLLTPRLRLRMG